MLLSSETGHPVSFRCRCRRDRLALRDEANAPFGQQGVDRKGLTGEARSGGSEVGGAGEGHKAGERMGTNLIMAEGIHSGFGHQSLQLATPSIS